MSSLRKWAGTPTSRSTVFTTEANSLANGSYTAVGTALDNTANLDMYCDVEIALASLTPTTGAKLTLFMLVSNDGTTYEDPPSSTNPGFGCQNISVPVSTGVGAKKVTVGPFLLPPKKVKFVLLNSANVALASSGNTGTAYTYNETNNG